MMQQTDFANYDKPLIWNIPGLVHALRTANVVWQIQSTELAAMLRPQDLVWWGRAESCNQSVLLTTPLSS